MEHMHDIIQYGALFAFLLTIVRLYLVNRERIVNEVNLRRDVDELQKRMGSGTDRFGNVDSKLDEITKSVHGIEERMVRLETILELQHKHD